VLENHDALHKAPFAAIIVPETMLIGRQEPVVVVVANVANIAKPLLPMASTSA